MAQGPVAEPRARGALDLRTRTSSTCSRSLVENASEINDQAVSEQISALRPSIDLKTNTFLQVDKQRRRQRQNANRHQVATRKRLPSNHNPDFVVDLKAIPLGAKISALELLAKNSAP